MAHAAQPHKVIMRYVAGVSWPRSGHHLLVRIMASYFGPNFYYCEYHGEKDCCRNFPCSRRHQTFSKCHDFEGTHVRPSGTPILVQYRSFIPAVISWFDQRIAEDGYEDSRDAFWQHAAEAARYYDIFAMKWIEPTSNNCLKLRYEDLISDTLFWCGDC